MIISFFEEFPTKKNLDKVKLIDFPTKLYIAAHSLDEFKSIKKQIKSKYVREIIYWPILKKKEGYWFSPFTKQKALKNTFKQLKGKNISVMFDMELPFSKLLILKNLFQSHTNKHLINKFIKDHKKIYVCEYFIDSKLFSLFGLEYNKPKNHHLIKMAYSSMYDHGENKLNQVIQKYKKRFGNKFIMAYGVLTKGVLGWEKPITTSLLKRDLDIAKKNKVKEVILFRLGGLNKKYIKLLKEY
tara:strand:- start:4503 stop:5228 length:726 start_codon:yes stop_codon:yes gene_type:complete